MFGSLRLTLGCVGERAINDGSDVVKDGRYSLSQQTRGEKICQSP